MPLYDTQCGAKLIRADAARQIFAEPFISRWIFDVELIARLIERCGERINEAMVEVPLRQWTGVAGSKVKPSSFLVAFTDLIKIAAKYKCHSHLKTK